MFRNMKLGLRIGLGFGAVTLLTVVIALLAWNQLGGLGEDIDLVVNDRMVKNRQANEIIDVSDMNEMSRQHDLGDLDVMVPVDKYKGAFAEMAQGVNGNLLALNAAVEAARAGDAGKGFAGGRRRCETWSCGAPKPPGPRPSSSRRA